MPRQAGWSVSRIGIVDLGSDATFGQEGAQPVAVLAKRDRQVDHRAVAAIDETDPAPRGGLVAIEDAPAFRIVGVEMRQHGREDRGLDLVHPRIAAPGMRDLVFRRPAILLKPPHGRDKVGIAGDHRAAVTHRTEVLGRIETEGRDIAHRTGHPVADVRAVRLGTILDDHDIRETGPVHRRTQRGNIHRISVKVCCDHRDGAGGQRTNRSVDGKELAPLFDVGVRQARGRPAWPRSRYSRRHWRLSRSHARRRRGRREWRASPVPARRCRWLPARSPARRHKRRTPPRKICRAVRSATSPTARRRAPPARSHRHVPHRVGADR